MSTPSPVYIVFPAHTTNTDQGDFDYPTMIRYTYYDNQDRRCHTFVARFEGGHRNNEHDACVCAIALAAREGCSYDISRVPDFKP